MTTATASDTFQVGDQIIHQTYGPGIITGIEEKSLADKPAKYYAIKTGALTFWIPVESTENRIRFPVTPAELHTYLEILSEKGDPLPDFHRDRQGALAERMKSADLSEICLVIRDLASRAKDTALNNNDRGVMETAQGLLVNEWEIVAGITRAEATTELDLLLA